MRTLGQLAACTVRHSMSGGAPAVCSGGACSRGLSKSPLWGKGSLALTTWSLQSQLATPATLLHEQRRHAGHSKWANIKHVKQAKDFERSSQTTRFVNMLKIAIREGGGSTDPKLNSKVATVFSQIKEAKLSMAAFEKMLQREAAKKSEKTQTVLFKGPGGCVLVVDISSDNLNRAKQELNPILRKNKGILGEDSLLHLFEHKGVILCNEVNGVPVDSTIQDQVVADAIEAGADDVTFQSGHPDFGNVYEFTTDPNAFFRVKHALEKINYTVVAGDVEYIPKISIDLDDSVLQEALKLCEKLSDHPNVVKVVTNIT